jgi:hypothetical protein
LKNTQASQKLPTDISTLSTVLSLAGTFKAKRTKKHPVDRIRDFISYER